MHKWMLGVALPNVVQKKKIHPLYSSHGCEIQLWRPRQFFEAGCKIVYFCLSLSF